MDDPARPPADPGRSPPSRGGRLQSPGDGPILREEERLEIRESLISFMNGDSSTRPSPPITRPRRVRGGFWSSVAFRTGALVCAFLLVGAAAAAASVNSVPGDMLYPLKVEVLEPVRGRFASTDAHRVRWEAERAMRRLHEAEQLNAREMLTDTARRALHALFMEHVDEIEHHIDALAREGQEELAAQLHADLDARLWNERRLLIGSTDDE